MKNSSFEQLPVNFHDSVINAISTNHYESIYFKDLDSRFLLMSQFMANYFNLDSIEDAIGKTDFDFFTRQHAQLAYEDEQEVIRTEKPILGKVEMETWENDLISYVVTSKYPLYDTTGTLIGTWGHSIAIAISNENNSEVKIPKAKALEQTFETTNNTIIDLLTGLKNSKAFYERMNLFYQDSMNTLSLPNKDHYLLLIDLKDFTLISKKYGYNFGNQSLVFTANLIGSVIFEDCELFRFGEDEFALLIKNHTFDDIIELANKVLSLLSITEFSFEGFSIYLSASIGISRFRESLPFGNIHDIVNQTDKRLLAAKVQETSTIIYDNSYRV